jgi:hypothetical protein
MKIVKASPDLIREWRINSSHLVTDEGVITGRLDPSLENSLATVIRTARTRLKSVRQDIAIGKLKSVVDVTVVRTGRNDTEYTCEVRVDGQRVVSGREIIAARLLDEHGECQLRHPNGVILKVIRDLGIHRPTFAESLQIAPKPQNCSCAAWGNPHPGVHYKTCPWNKLAPPDEQAPEGPTAEELETLPIQAFASLARGHATQVTVSRPDPKQVIMEPAPLDSPENCRNGCLKHATPKGVPIPAGQHHPMCPFAMPWAQKTAKDRPRYLIDLRTGEKVRPATDSEIGQSDVSAKRTGSPIIHVDDVPYAVLLETELGDGVDMGTGPEPEGKAHSVALGEAVP